MYLEYPFTTKKGVLMSVKNNYSPIPNVFKVCLSHEQEWNDYDNLFTSHLFIKSIPCPIGLPVVPDGVEPIEAYWSFPGGMKALHALYRNSWVESATIHWTVSSAVSQLNFEASFFITNYESISDLVGGFGHPAGEIPPGRYDSFRSLPSSVTKMASFQSGGRSIITCSQSFDLGALNPQYIMDSKYSTESSLDGHMTLHSPENANLRHLPCFAVATKGLTNLLDPNIQIKYRIEYNMRFANLHPFQTVDPRIPEPEPP